MGAANEHGGWRCEVRGFDEFCEDEIKTGGHLFEIKAAHIVIVKETTFHVGFGKEEPQWLAGVVFKQVIAECLCALLSESDCRPMTNIVTQFHRLLAGK